MEAKTAKWLHDIANACDFIVSAAEQRTLPDYKSDRLFRAAMERYLEIVGEALNRIRKNDPESAARIPEFAAIIAFRNVLIHGYDLIDHERVWQVIRRDVPELPKHVTLLLNRVSLSFP